MGGTQDIIKSSPVPRKNQPPPPQKNLFHHQHQMIHLHLLQNLERQNESKVDWSFPPFATLKKDIFSIWGATNDPPKIHHPHQNFRSSVAGSTSQSNPYS